MSSMVLDVRKIPNLLVAKFHANMFSWREENGAVIFQPAEERLSFDKRKQAWEELKKFRGVLPEDFDYKKELSKRIDEKYGNIH